MPMRRSSGAREELIGSSLLDLMNEEQQRQFKAQLAALTPEAPTISYEMDTILADGSRGWEQWTDRALFDADGRLVEYQSVGRDITEARRTREELRQSEARFRAIVEDQTEVIGRFDKDLRLVFSEPCQRPPLRQGNGGARRHELRSHPGAAALGAARRLDGADA